MLAWGNTVMEPHLFESRPERGAATLTRTKAKSFFTCCAAIGDHTGEGRIRLKAGDSFLFRERDPASLAKSRESGDLGVVGKYSANVLKRWALKEAR